MKALFITTPTTDCFNHVRAWRSIAQADHYVMHSRGIRIDWMVVQKVRDCKPDIVFYISANQGEYALKWQTLKEIRSVLKENNSNGYFINLCSDAADRPWHGVLASYDNHDCFDLQVSLDGGMTPHIGVRTLTPIDQNLFGISVRRDIRCGFSGSIGMFSQRSEIIRALEWLGGLTIRDREDVNGYENHANFLNRCQLMLNTSWTGTGLAHHIKGRVLEAGFAGCALLESAGSPISDWFSADCYFIWHDVKEAAQLIRDLDEKSISVAAEKLSREVRARYSADSIYGGIINKLGLKVKDFVDITLQKQTA